MNDDTELDALRTMVIKATMQTTDADLLDLVYKIMVQSSEDAA